MFFRVKADTPYFGGIFRLKLILCKGFPAQPPKAYFITKIFHPNVASNGEICVNTLKKDWKPELGIKHILLVSSIFYSFVHIFTLVLCKIELKKFKMVFFIELRT